MIQRLILLCGVPVLIIACAPAPVSPTPEPPRALTEQPAPKLTTSTFFPSVDRNADWEPALQIFNGVEMALVPAGCFQMGREDGDSDEAPVHEVCFEEPFWIDVYEVTNEASGTLGCQYASSDANQPRNCVSWTESFAHCEARGARLPTEAEWEYAARGPDGLLYPWGDEFVPDNVIYSRNSNNQTQEIGTKPGGASWVGAFDLSGNVWEWTSDWYGSYPSEKQIDPQGPASGSTRVLRGGSWNSTSGMLTTAVRLWHAPTGVTFNSGFRCALSWQP